MEARYSLTDRAHGAEKGGPGSPPSEAPPNPALPSIAAALRRPGHDQRPRRSSLDWRLQSPAATGSESS